MKKLKRANRGFILAGIAIIALVIYTAVDSVIFSAAVKDMRSQIERDFARLAEISVLGEQYIGEGNSPAPEGVERLKSGFVDYINSVMISPIGDLTRPSHRWAPDKVYFLGQSKLFEQSNGTVLSYDAEVTRVDVQKEGPGLAYIIVNYRVKIETIGGDTYVPFLGGLERLGYLRYRPLPDYDLHLRHTMNGNAHISAKYEGGEWKYYYVDGGHFDYSVEVLGGTPPNIDDVNPEDNDYAREREVWG